MINNFFCIIVVGFLSLFIINCQSDKNKSIDKKDKSVYNNAFWGMSIDEIKQLYKVPPTSGDFKSNPATIEYLENVDGYEMSFSATYSLDSKDGLNKISIYVACDSSSYSQNKMGKFLDAIEKTVLKSHSLVDSASYSMKLYEWLSEKHVIDRVYKSEISNIRSGLSYWPEEQTTRTYRINIDILPPNKIWEKMPTDVAKITP